jgi:hypothetical protein
MRSVDMPTIMPILNSLAGPEEDPL